MARTSPSSATASPADSSPPDLPAPGGLCAIHQPNLFPRLTTLAKILAADCWIVLDDVQFTRRDYQHRARLTAYDDPPRPPAPRPPHPHPRSPPRRPTARPPPHRRPAPPALPHQPPLGRRARGPR